MSVQDSKHPGCVPGSGEKTRAWNRKKKRLEIRAGEKEISFWEPLSQTRMMYCSFFYFVKSGSLRLGFWTVGVHITMLQSQWCLFTLQILGRPQNPKEGFASQPFLFVHRLKKPCRQILQRGIPQNATLNNSTSSLLVHFCHFCLSMSFSLGQDRNFRMHCKLLN